MNPTAAVTHAQMLICFVSHFFCLQAPWLTVVMQMCNGRVISALEGGYAATSVEAGLAVSVQSHVEALCGLSQLEDFAEVKIVENVRVQHPELYQGLPSMSSCFCCVGNKRAFNVFSQLDKPVATDEDILCEEVPPNLQ